MYRRAFLATVVLSLAGCSESREESGSLSMKVLPDDAAIARRYAGTTENLSRERRALVEAAIAGDSPREPVGPLRTKRRGHSNTTVPSTTSLGKLSILGR